MEESLYNQIANVVPRLNDEERKEVTNLYNRINKMRFELEDLLKINYKKENDLNRKLAVVNAGYNSFVKETKEKRKLEQTITSLKHQHYLSDREYLDICLLYHLTL